MIFLPDLFLDDFLHRVEMIVFENVVFELFQLLVAEGTAMVPVDCLLDAAFAVDVAASCYVAIVYGVHADCALELLV